MNNRIIILLFVGVLMAALDIAIIGPALPALKNAFNISDKLLAWLINIYILTNLAGTPFLGKLSDVYGRRGIYILSIGLFLLGSIIVASSTNFTLLMLGRGVQGFGSGGIFPIASAVIGDTIQKEKQGRALGLIGAVFGLAFTIGPIIGGILLLLSWQWIFLINIPIALIIMLGAYKLIPTKVSSLTIKFDWLGMFILIVALSSFSYGINNIDPKDFINSLLSIAILPYIFLGIILIPIFYKIQLHSQSPTINTRLLNNKQLLLAYFLSAGTAFGEIAVMFLPSYAVVLFRLDESVASFMIVPLAISLFVGAPVAGRIIDKIGTRLVIVIGLLLSVCGLILFFVIDTSKALFYVADIVLGFGLAFLMGAPLRYIINRETFVTDRASGQSLLSIFNASGKLIVAALTSALIGGLGGNNNAYQTSYLVILSLMTSLIFVAMLLKNKTQEQVMGN